MNKNKKLIFVALLLVCVIGISIIGIYSNNDTIVLANDNSETYKTYSYIDELNLNDVARSTVYGEFEYEFTPEYMLEVSDAVVIASVISVDTANTQVNKAVGNTYGKMVINNSLYGDMKEGTTFDYMKSGGTMTLEEYDRYQIPEMRAKHERLRKQSGVDGSSVYVNLHFENDPDIEAGKTYLCYLKYINSIDKFEIVGLGNGFRELDIIRADAVPAGNIELTGHMIYNNETKKYESLEEYIEKHL